MSLVLDATLSGVEYFIHSGMYEHAERELSMLEKQLTGACSITQRQRAKVVRLQQLLADKKKRKS